MIFWVDAQLPPNLADWLRWTFKVEAYALRELGLRDADDLEIFKRAQQEGIVLISKDSDFVELLLRQQPPPQLLWVTCGNTTNQRLQELFDEVFPHALQLLVEGHVVVELADKS
jgi:predicted nuclease of predicted toxin-antitoxin system